MKVALCLCGLVGTDDKYGTGTKTINFKIGLKHFKKHVFDVNDDVDVFLHTWSTEYEDQLINAYNPVDCKAEPQLSFSDDPREQAIHSRWKATKEVLNLVQASGNVYDFILLTRYDVAFLVDFDFSKFNNSKFYAQGPTGPKTNGIDMINDLWFFSNQENMMKFSTLYDSMDTANYIKHKNSNHELARRHLIETGIHDNLEYVYRRDWSGAKGKKESDTPLIRWYYMDKV